MIDGIKEDRLGFGIVAEARVYFHLDLPGLIIFFVNFFIHEFGLWRVGSYFAERLFYDDGVCLNCVSAVSSELAVVVSILHWIGPKEMPNSYHLVCVFVTMA